MSGSRLRLAREEIDRVFGDGHAAAHPELVAVVGWLEAKLGPLAWFEIEDDEAAAGG